MNERKYLIDIILKKLIEDILDELEYFPANFDLELDIDKYDKKLSDIADRIIEEKPLEIYKFIKEELKGEI